MKPGIWLSSRNSRLRCDPCREWTTPLRIRSRAVSSLYRSLVLHSANNVVIIKFSALAVAQQDNEELSALRDKPSSLELCDVEIPPGAVPVFHDVSTGTPRPVVPSNFWCTVFDALHN